MTAIEKITRSLIHYWAIGGGILLLAVVLVNTASIALGIFGDPIPGDVELTEMGVAVSVFAFLPYCQLHYANVTADIFTSRASPAFLKAVEAITSVVAMTFAVLLAWWMYKGMVDRYNYDYTSAVLLIPMWMPYVPVLLSVMLLFVASTITFKDNILTLFSRQAT